MSRKDVFKGALEALINPTDGPARPQSKSILHSAALGGVESGLARGLQLLDLEPDQISQSEFEDRLPYDEASLSDLIASIREHGQQIPILVQRHAPNEYRVIYGRRRIAAARVLGAKVRALVTQMDDEQRIITQGIENSVRQDLSFIEKAMFAHRLREADVPEQTIRASLNIDVGAPKATTISTMKMVVETLGEDIIQAIGRAPGIGRPRWRNLAEAFRDRAGQFAGANRPALLKAIETSQFTSANSKNVEEADASDLRFKRAAALIVQVTSKTPLDGDAAPVMSDDKIIAILKRTPAAVSVTVRAKDDPKFHAWLHANADTVMKALYDQCQEETAQHQPVEEAR
ncbi:plasmid partitioning protein RepB [Cypionkella psychrotolerans]|uniref:plasmid partitioning protein RepB n=1 Tax=Cypionkella psychrotolerans TaxID=1678131 RepID=UPI0006B49314|nr:plasmid partitioning protein RepB [Cypionkella psychrotolerans]